MLDKLLLNVVNSGGRNPLNSDIVPEATLASLQVLSGANHGKLIVIFPYWSSSANATMQRLAKRLNHDGKYVILPELHENYMQANIDFVLSAYKYLSDEIAQEVLRLFSSGKISSIQLIGFSMGNVLLCNTSAKLSSLPNIEITQVLGASEIAGPLWEGSRTAHLRESFIDQGVELQGLRKSWKQLDPISIELPSNVSKIELITSKNDGVIPTSYQEEYANHLKSCRPNLLHKRLSTNHVLSLARYIYLHKY